MARLVTACFAALACAHGATVFTVDTSAPISVPLNQPLLDCVGSGHSVLDVKHGYATWHDNTKLFK